MAKRRNLSGSSRRGDTSTANTTQLVLPLTVRGSALSDYEDRRFFNPDDIFAPARTFTGKAKIVARPRGRPKGSKSRSQQKSLKKILTALQFNAPEKVLICVRRKRRKEVMFASGKAGKRGQKKPRRNFYSDINC